MTRVSEELKQAIVESYLNGHGMRTIAAHFGVSYTTVRYHLFATGMNLRRKGRRVREKVDGQVKEIIG